MDGPFPLGTFDLKAPITVRSWEYGKFDREKVYTVIKNFHDSKGHLHPVGETWTFMGSGYSPYDETLVIFVRVNGSQEWRFDLIYAEGFQLEIAENIKAYIKPV